MRHGSRLPNFATSSPPAKTAWRSRSAEPQALTPTSPLRHENQQGSLSPKTAKLLKLYQDDIELHLAPRAARGYLDYVRTLALWLGGRGIEAGHAKTEDLHAYQRELHTRHSPQGRPYSLGYQACQITAVKSFYRFLYKRLLILRDPAAALELPRLDKRLPRTILSREEVLRILAVARERTAIGLRDRAILETLYATGIRYSELAKLALYDVDPSERVLRVVLGKGRKDRNVPLTRAACHAIEDYLVHGRPKLVVNPKLNNLFLSDKGGFMHCAVVNDRLRLWARKARLKKHVTCHTFRHSVATHLLRGHADIRHIQALLGHASLGTTERYTRVEISDLKKVIARAHPRGR